MCSPLVACYRIWVEEMGRGDGERRAYGRLEERDGDG